jgi:RNA polymerase-binding transcription factor
LNIEHYKRRLREEEARLLALIDRTQEEAREASSDSVGDSGDASVADEMKEERFKEAETYSDQLRQVRAALQRIEDGTYGRCLVDGKPIDEKRLRATPWAEYCLRHEQAREQAAAVKTPTL